MRIESVRDKKLESGRRFNFVAMPKRMVVKLESSLESASAGGYIGMYILYVSRDPFSKYLRVENAHIFNEPGKCAAEVNKLYAQRTRVSTMPPPRGHEPHLGFNRTAFHTSFFENFITASCIDVHLEKYEISKDLEISVKACGTIRRCPIEIQVRSRIRIQQRRRLLTVETHGSARASDIKRPGPALWSSSVILTTPVALRARLYARSNG